MEPVASSIRDVTSRVLLKSHRVWSRLVPSFYYPYRVAGGRVYLDISESRMMLARALGRYETEKMAALREYLRPGDTFLDVGANKGDFSIAASRIVGSAGRVIAFEPVATNCRWMERSIARSQAVNIELHQLALADRKGEAELFLGRKSGWHSLTPDLPNRNVGTVTVSTQSLDGFLKEHESTRIDVIKIDVEGAEMSVLKGARTTLETNSRVVVLLDVHPDLGVEPTEVAEFMKDLGFGLFKENPPFDEPIADSEPVHSLVARRR